MPRMINVRARQVPEEVEKQPAFGVEHQDIAAPDQIGVHAPDHEQPEHAPIIDAADVGSARLGPLVHQHEPGAEEHREGGHHLHFEEEMIEVPDESIEACESTASGRITVRDSGEAERDDVHRQNAQKRDAAHHVNREITLRARDWLSARCSSAELRP